MSSTVVLYQICFLLSKNFKCSKEIKNSYSWIFLLIIGFLSHKIVVL